MTPQEQAFWKRFQQRVANLEPALGSELLKAFDRIRDLIGERAFLNLIEQGDIGAMLRQLDDATLDSAFRDFRQTMYNQVVDGVKYFGRDIATQGVGIQFNVLNPKMIEAVRALDTRVMQELRTEVRDVVRSVTERGIRDGINPRQMARDLRQAIGLGPSQEKHVENLRQALIDRDAAKVKTYLLRDKRFDTRIARGDYGPDEIEKWTDIYRKRRIAQNAETNARTAALDAQKLAQHMSWESAIERGIVDREKLMKRWTGTLDSRERREHVEMEGETVQFDEPFSHEGQQIPGSTEWNCRCLARYSTRIQRQPKRGSNATVEERQQLLRNRQAAKV